MRRLINRARDERGASAVFIAMTMTIVLIVAALVVDIGAAISRDAQLQDAADAAALSLAQRCYEDPATTDLDGCAPAVRAGAAGVAEAIAVATVGDGVASVVGEPEFSDGTVTVNLASTQNALFSWSAGSSETDVAASATAQWNTAAVALPLAVNSCTLGEPSDDLMFVGTGLYDGVSSLVSQVTALLGERPNLDDYLEGLLDCGTNLLAGGWLAEIEDDCSFDPRFDTYVNATVVKVLPVESCAAVIQGLIGKRVIVPVYESATANAVDSLLGEVDVERYAEIIVTGYDFQGVLGLGPLVSYPSGRDPGCITDPAEFLGLDNTALGPLLTALLGPIFLQLAPELLACQGLQGQLVDDDLTPEEAAEILTPYRLVA